MSASSATGQHRMKRKHQSRNAITGTPPLGIIRTRIRKVRGQLAERVRITIFRMFPAVAEKHHPWWNGATEDLPIAVYPRCHISLNPLRSNPVKGIFTGRSTLALGLHRPRSKEYQHPPV